MWPPARHALEVEVMKQNMRRQFDDGLLNFVDELRSICDRYNRSLALVTPTVNVFSRPPRNPESYETTFKVLVGNLLHSMWTSIMNTMYVPPSHHPSDYFMRYGVTGRKFDKPITREPEFDEGCGGYINGMRLLYHILLPPVLDPATISCHNASTDLTNHKIVQNLLHNLIDNLGFSFFTV